MLSKCSSFSLGISVNRPHVLREQVMDNLATDATWKTPICSAMAECNQ